MTNPTTNDHHDDEFDCNEDPNTPDWLTEAPTEAQMGYENDYLFDPPVDEDW